MLYGWRKRSSRTNGFVPKIKFPDFYGVDMPTKKELLKPKNLDEMCDYIKAKSLKFLSLDGLYETLGKGQRNKNVSTI